jgi:DNA-directed RNA polymerase subunit E'/Rpb7
MSKTTKINKSSKNETINETINETKNETKNEIINEIINETTNSTLNNHKTHHKISEKEESTFKNSNLHSPYINTTLVCPIMLSPNQMDNKLYLHIKDNLSNKLVGRCYKNYGFIVKIYKIDEISDGIIEAEDPTCSSKFIVKFSCKLCIPIKNKEIIFKIDRMNKALIGGINGPLQAIITPDKINKDKFYPDNNRNIIIRNSHNILLPEMYIRVLVLSSSFSDYEKTILVIGFLQDIATEEEYNNFIQNNEKEQIQEEQ